jgi:hypothetical protein
LFARKKSNVIGSRQTFLPNQQAHALFVCSREKPAKKAGFLPATTPY